MKNGVATVPTILLPESAQLLGIVCDALRLTLPRSRKANGRRFLTGERTLPEEARFAIVRSLVEEALLLGYLGESVATTAERERDRWIEQVSSGAIILMRRWDHAVGHLVGVQLPQLERTTLVTECLRAAVVDVAIRAAAFRLLAKLPLMSPATKAVAFEVPSWAQPGGAAAGLARLVRQSGIKHDALHDSNTLDDWLRGRRRPSPASLRKLALKLAGDESIGSWRQHLLWDFGLAYIADALRAVVGDDVVADLAAALRRLTYLCISHMASLPVDRREAALIELVQGGAMAPVAREICEVLQQQEGLALRVEWARALALGGRPWSLLWLVASLPAVPELTINPPIPAVLVERVNAWIHDPARDPGELLKICENHSALYLWLMRLVIHRAVISGEFAAAAPIVGALADALGGAKLHLEAAALLVGGDQHDEVARHLAAIPPDDGLRGAADALAAMQHMVVGRHQEALHALNAIEDDGPMILRARAEALFGLGQASAALELLERVIARVPRDAIAIELASRCCDALGRTREATRYKKAADRLGRPRARATRAERGRATRSRA